jgi:hypothetical protein
LMVTSAALTVLQPVHCLASRSGIKTPLQSVSHMQPPTEAATNRMLPCLHTCCCPSDAMPTATCTGRRASGLSLVPPQAAAEVILPCCITCCCVSDAMPTVQGGAPPRSSPPSPAALPATTSGCGRSSSLTRRCATRLCLTGVLCATPA